MKNKINKWQFIFKWGGCYYRNHSREFIFGIFKIISFPKEGEQINKNNYKGFIIKKEWKSFNITLEL